MTRLIALLALLVVPAFCGGCDTKSERCRGSVETIPTWGIVACYPGANARLDHAHGLVICECPPAADGGAK